MICLKVISKPSSVNVNGWSLDGNSDEIWDVVFYPIITAALFMSKWSGRFFLWNSTTNDLTDSNEAKSRWRNSRWSRLVLLLISWITALVCHVELSNQIKLVTLFSSRQAKITWKSFSTSFFAAILPIPIKFNSNYCQRIRLPEEAPVIMQTFLLLILIKIIKLLSKYHLLTRYPIFKCKNFKQSKWWYLQLLRDKNYYKIEKN